MASALLYSRGLYPRFRELESPSNTSGKEWRKVLFLAYDSLLICEGTLRSSDSLLVELTTDLARSRSFSDTPNVSVWCLLLGLCVIWEGIRVSFTSLKLFDRMRELTFDSLLVFNIDIES